MTKLEYENSLREVGWDEDCIFAAVHGFSIGYTRAIADVVEWLRSHQMLERTLDDHYADEIENKFLRGEK